ncbi:MAG: hypothetical protein HYX41_00130 [Bdellovibrio sp.]|nr:hypothetical protein [Bdellovibrio sp.]
MWIAKPIRQITTEEERVWREFESKLTLSQKLCWASAIEAVSGKAYLVFSPDEKVGGMVFSTSPGVFESINGPELNWDDPQKISRQFATFANAVAKLSTQFRSLTICPRWSTAQTQERLASLPIPPNAISHACTVVVPVHENPTEQSAGFSQRLRRTLKKTLFHKPEINIERCTENKLKSFASAMQSFASAKGFSSPPLSFFEALVKPAPSKSHGSDPVFWLITSTLRVAAPQPPPLAADPTPAVAEAQILLSVEGHHAAYLFGLENRDPGIPSSLSVSAAAHWEALRLCARHKVTEYDLNGYLDPQFETGTSEPRHPYTGVAEFKRQFQGRLVQYSIPRFQIE